MSEDTEDTTDGARAEAAVTGVDLPHSESDVPHGELPAVAPQNGEHLAVLQLRECEKWSGRLQRMSHQSRNQSQISAASLIVAWLRSILRDVVVREALSIMFTIATILMIVLIGAESMTRVIFQYPTGVILALVARFL
ncbi:hypothetical protein K458DRAFT_392520 [Lentithecium fluviatile CBS 122367]|uniref:Uncharacterized protein n=1 Tax=Lentithecium fluviatile CBS 122367 TaxID=1168545 RepID=A0A6G1ISK1_9PLEO|nr:hypothetical protein K458DRAFT_392520 [Lentithecium fluviatile CBS 122367]